MQFCIEPTSITINGSSLTLWPLQQHFNTRQAHQSTHPTSIPSARRIWRCLLPRQSLATNQLLVGKPGSRLLHSTTVAKLSQRIPPCTCTGRALNGRPQQIRPSRALCGWEQQVCSLFGTASHFDDYTVTMPCAAQCWPGPRGGRTCGSGRC